MKQEYKKLLIKDLCSRLPYNVKFCIEVYDEKHHKYKKGVGMVFQLNHNNFWIYEDDFERSINCGENKPYLFPLSSMTTEQKNECFKGTPLEISRYDDIAVKDALYGGCLYTDLEIYLEVIDYLNKNHFDYRGLIPVGLAIDVTGKNIY